jgi:hypothetical protein
VGLREICWADTFCVEDRTSTTTRTATARSLIERMTCSHLTIRPRLATLYYNTIYRLVDLRGRATRPLGLEPDDEILEDQLLTIFTVTKSGIDAS